ncbi:hypothetical protein F8C76_10215 [Flagellimonas olearia]|uniref:LA2681-like HEPN domain-containing protein n=1 Tax=Flagellimonas olearia TaxID=552546 RepID=A0A6I1E3V2_9FLAO|nr:LA2681 family HEPN domain-containing protein [Allomuricauda olearia]KAB7528236.1 hypothetical protein F8C76_10215 [Allomuricauda olearia]
MSLTYEEILTLEDLNCFEPNQAVYLLGLIFETGREYGRVGDIKIGLKFSEKQNLRNFSDDDKMTFHYNLANGWSYLQGLTQNLNSDDFWNFDLVELDQQIINLRQSLVFSKNAQDNFKKCEVLTNLGNLFSHIGRFSEAQLYWQSALEIDSSFSMAKGNIGFGLFHYAKILYDDGHKFLFFQFAYKYLNKAIVSDIYDEAKIGFQGIVDLLESRFHKKDLKKIQNLTDFSIGDTELEREYRIWSLQNRLFLNPLNDVITDNIAGSDCLLLPTMTLKFDKPPIYQTIFNQIKQEFVTARHFLFESVNHKELHYSDKDNLQLDILDSAIYSFNTEKIKTAFRMCYSILDKIGYLINDYLNLGFKSDRVSFRGIWNVHDKKSNKLQLNDKIIKTQNWAFRGLYWLSRDLYEKNPEFSYPIEPEAKELAQIRNFIEHKSFKIIEHGESGLYDDGLTLVVHREEFEKKTLKLVKLIRASMIYLSLGINLEEKRKHISSHVFPIEFVKYRDEFKR